MTKRQDALDHLVGNCQCGSSPFTPEDLPTLSKLSDEALFKLASNVDDSNMEDDEDEEDDEIEDSLEEESEEEEYEEDEKEEAVTNMGCGKKKGKGKNMRKMEDEEEATGNKAATTKAPLTANEWLAQAPEEVRRMVRNAMAHEAAQRDQFIAKITANHRNAFTEAQLKSMPLEVLAGMASLASEDRAVQNSFLGASVPLTTANTKKKLEPLVVPTMNFNDEKE